jgi:type IX secretion system PorP/SprF family membrane protein
MFNNLIKKQWTMLLLLTILVGNSKVWAQQEKMFSQYMFNMLALNPAYAGSRDVLSATGLYRNQWSGIVGAPKTNSFTIDSPINSERVGLGFTAFNDQLGLENHTGFYGSYAFRIKLGERTTLALGLQGGVTNFRWNLAEAVLSAGGATNDPAFANNVVKWLPNFGTGVYLSNDRGYLGISVPNLIENNLSGYDSGDLRAKQKRHYYMMAGFVLGKNAIKVKPSMLVKYVNINSTPLGVDGNVNVWFHDRIAVGASYRYNRFSGYTQNATQADAVVGLFELQLNEQLRFGYSYDYTTSSLNHSKAFLSVPTHEIMLRYEFGFNKSKILTPRYF